MKYLLRAGGSALVATALSAAALAAPAGAATHHSIHSVQSHVKAADVALRKLDRVAHHNARQAKLAVSAVRKEASAARADAHYLRSHASAKTAAQAAGVVALQYDWDVRTFTSLIDTASPSVQPVLAGSLPSLLSGQTDILGLLSSLTGALSGSSATGAQTVLTGLIGSLPTEIGSLSGVLSGGDLTATLQGLLTKALGMASSALNQGVSQLQSVIATLPAPAQTAINGLITQLQSVLSQLQSVVAGLGSGTGTTSTGTGTTSTGTASGLLNLSGLSNFPGLSMLTQLFGALTGNLGSAGGTSSGSAGGILSAGGLGGGMLSGLLGQLGSFLPTGMFGGLI